LHQRTQENAMSINPLDPASVAGRPDRKVNQGHGTRALGPSDSSDSGSDVAGPNMGDAALDSDSDRFGTGERASADTEDIAPEGADIDADHIEVIPESRDEDAGEERS
jgi:hypothetical protein